MILHPVPRTPHKAPPGLGGHPWQWLANMRARRKRQALLRALDAHMRADIGLPPPAGLAEAPPPPHRAAPD